MASLRSLSHSPSRLRIPPQDFPFSLSLFLRTIAFAENERRSAGSPARGAQDCYERICGNPRSNLHADGNGCVSSLIPRFCRRLLSRFSSRVAWQQQQQLARKKCRWPLMFYQGRACMYSHLSFKSCRASPNIDKNSKSIHVL